MLNNDVLAQLRQLKQNIHDSKDRGEGIVKGSQGRFGFVTLDDGREIYLPPEQMLRVFPDDRVAIEVVTGSEGKPLAQLERLLASPLRAFTGRYIVRDNAHFVETDLPKLSRWIFVPPKLRRGAKQGDWVRASITQHPFNDSKPQARVDAIIGNDTQKGVESRYALARFALPDSAPTLIEGDLEQPDLLARRDLTALPLVTIDGFDTRDMDDALHAERIAKDAADAGWKLTVAIADPSAWIKPDSTLEKIIAARSTSAYLPGLSVPMLPEQLANGQCSLLPDVERLALVCEMWIDNAGIISRYEFSEARVRSHAKLSYSEVAEFLRAPSTDEVTPNAWAESLRELHAVSTSLRQRRQRDLIILPERNEYRAQLDDNGKVASYQRQSKSASHLLVEECMIATNSCAAHFLQQDSLLQQNGLAQQNSAAQPNGQRDAHAIFISHRGFRSERLDNVNKLLAAELRQFAQKNVAELPDYIALMQTLATEQFALPLREILFRSLERAQFSASAAPHFGMGLPCYTTITSPIRKFNDYLSQRALKAKLRGASCAAISAETIAQLQDCSDRARQASNFAQQWLDCDYLLRQIERAKPSEQVWRGTLVHVMSSGFVVRLLDNGIQGFVDTRHTGEKFSFDQVYMRLSSAKHTFQLEQEVDVKIASIDMKKRSVAFALVAAEN